MVIHIIHPPFLGEVYELFIQLADPYCGIGFVTVAPINHYVTGWRGRELGGAWIYGGLMGKKCGKICGSFGWWYVSNPKKMVYKDGIHRENRCICTKTRCVFFYWCDGIYVVLLSRKMVDSCHAMALPKVCFDRSCLFAVFFVYKDDRQEHQMWSFDT